MIKLRSDLLTGVVGVVSSVAGLVLLLAVTAPLEAQQGRGKLSGSLTDEDGSPVVKAQLVLRPTKGGAPVNLKTDKKGRFSHGYLASGSYRIEAEDENLFLRHVDVVIREPTGVELNTWASDAHPDDGLPPIQVMFGYETRADIVVGDAADRARVRQAIAAAEVAGPMQTAMELYESGDMEATIAEVERILAEQPEIAFGHFLYGMALSRVDRLADAEAALRESLQLDPELQDAPGALGTLLLERGERASAEGRSGDALEYYAEAAELLQRQLDQGASGLAALRSNLVLALDKSEQIDEAIALLEEMIELEPDNASYYYHLAELYRQTEGGEAKALALLENVPETETTSVDVMYNIAVQHFNAGEIDKAMEVIDRALNVDPEFALLYHLRGRIFLAGSDYEGAMGEMRRFLEMAPDHPKAAEDRQILESLESVAQE